MIAVENRGTKTEVRVTVLTLSNAATINESLHFLCDAYPMQTCLRSCVKSQCVSECKFRRFPSYEVYRVLRILNMK